MTDSSIWSERSRRLQQSFSTTAIPSLPMMVPRPALKEKYHKLQRFGVTAAGRIERSEVVRPQVKNFILNEKLRIDGKTQGLYAKKHQLVREWEMLEEEERQMNYQESRKSSTSTNNNVQDAIDNYAPTGDERVPELSSSASAPILTSNSLRIPPRWVEFDREVLRFYLYFKEAVHESPKEKFRVRKCLLLYYMNDNTIQIEEPKEENSGLPQGVFLKRTALTKEDGAAYKPEDFLIGTEHTIFGRRFRVTNMDGKTRRYLESNSIDVGMAEPYPLDPFAEKKLQDSIARPKIESIAGRKTSSSLGQYLKNDKKVLKFKCIWDDTDRLYGERNEYSLHYFLSDDTIEVRNNSKADPFPLLLKRAKLLRDMDHPEKGYYMSGDIRCGEFINCYKRQLLVLSCDNYTEKYYARVHGIQQRRVKIKTVSRPVVVNELPPYNGFGSEADSLANCISLIPKPVKQDLHQFLNNRGKELRFRARLVSPEPEEVDRHFVITFFMDDDTVAIYEPPQRNSGIVGGKFLERGKYKKSIKVVVPRDPSYGLQRKLHETIETRLDGDTQGLYRAFRKFGRDEDCSIDYSNFILAMSKVLGMLPEDIQESECVALFNKFDYNGDRRINYNDFISSALEIPDESSDKVQYHTRWFQATDFYISAIISCVFPRTGAQTQEFEIVGADKTTLAIMEGSPDRFPRSDRARIISVLSNTIARQEIDMRQSFGQFDPNRVGLVNAETFSTLVKDWAKSGGLDDSVFSDHEVLSLVRKYQYSETDNRVRYPDFCDAVLGAQPPSSPAVGATAKQVLRQFASVRGSKNLRGMFRRLDVDSSGSVTWVEFQQVLWNSGIELQEEELNVLMQEFDANRDGRVTYNEFCDAIYGAGRPNIDKRDTFERSPAASPSVSIDPRAYMKEPSRVRTPTMGQYKAALLAAQRQKDEFVELKALMKAFSSGYYIRKHTLRKNFLAFDLDNRGTVGKAEFEEALVRTNNDFSKQHKKMLINYFFPDSRPCAQLDYDEFMTIMFKNDLMTAARKFGTSLSSA